MSKPGLSSGRIAAWASLLVKKLAVDVETETENTLGEWCRYFDPEQEGDAEWFTEHFPDEYDRHALLDAIDNLGMITGLGSLPTYWVCEHLFRELCTAFDENRAQYIDDDALTRPELDEIKAAVESFYEAVDRRVESILEDNVGDFDVIRAGSHPRKNQITPQMVEHARSSITVIVRDEAVQTVVAEGFVWNGTPEFDEGLVSDAELYEMIYCLMCRKLRDAVPQWKPSIAPDEYTPDRIEAAIYARVKLSWALGGASYSNRSKTNQNGAYGNPWFNERTVKMRSQ